MKVASEWQIFHQLYIYPSLTPLLESYSLTKLCGGKICVLSGWNVTNEMYHDVLRCRSSYQLLETDI